LPQTSFLDKTLLAVANVVGQSLFSEVYAYRRGFLQSLDVRIKLLSFLFILVIVSFLRSPQTLWILYGLSLVLAISSRVSLVLFLKRVWLFVPLFSAAIVLPALLNIITPGANMGVIRQQIYTWGPYTIPAEIALPPGLWSAITFVSRVLRRFHCRVVHTHNKVGRCIFGLRAFSFHIFVMTLSMTERYLFIFLRLIQDMYRARKSRTIRPLPAAMERSWTASRIGVTFKKSLDMSEDIYNAMLSRGFHGEFRTVGRFRTNLIDYMWLVTVICFGGILILLERSFFLQ
jgi:cobalt/nickel transport system permease protein